MPEVKENIPLASLTTFHTGGAAQFAAVVRDPHEVRACVQWAKERSLPWRVLGGGSNVLAPDATLPGLTLLMQISGRSVAHEGSDVVLRVGAGEVHDDVVAYACREGWWGLENLSAIPGSVGALPIQNVGAYGVETKDLLVSVECYDAHLDQMVTLTHEECQFSYRHSRFKDESGRYVVLSVALRLAQHAQPRIEYRDLAHYFASSHPHTLTPSAVRAAVIEIRAKKFPDWRVVGTAGSFFKNPTISHEHFLALQRDYPHIVGHAVGVHEVKVSLGWILEHVCGMRGVREGSVGTYPAQALVVVNYGGATTHDIIAFGEHIAALVYEKTHIVIEREVTLLS